MEASSSVVAWTGEVSSDTSSAAAIKPTGSASSSPRAATASRGELKEAAGDVSAEVADAGESTLAAAATAPGADFS